MRTLSVFMMVIFSCVLNAQDVRIEMDRSEIRIGERISITARATVNDPGQLISWPEFTDTFTTSKIEILSRTPPTQLSANEQQVQFTVTSFDSGYHAIPPLELMINGSPVLSNALLLRVNSVEVDTTQQFRDIKEIYDEPFSWSDFFLDIIYWLKENWLVTLGIILVVALLVYLLLKSRKKEEPVPPAPVVDPYLEAYSRLRVIEKEQIWQHGLYKEYYTSISDALRHYIERRYQVAALEQTTDEVIRSLRLTEIEEDARRHLVYVLKLSDLAKFAKEQPAPHENDAALSRAFQFIEITKPKTISNNE